MRIRSLNYIVKKKEIERIDRENNKMVDLIVNCKPGMQSARNMAQEYEAKRKIVQPKRNSELRYKIAKIL